MPSSLFHVPPLLATKPFNPLYSKLTQDSRGKDMLRCSLFYFKTQMCEYKTFTCTVHILSLDSIPWRIRTPLYAYIALSGCDLLCPCAQKHKSNMHTNVQLTGFYVVLKNPLRFLQKFNTYLPDQHYMSQSLRIIQLLSRFYISVFFLPSLFKIVHLIFWELLLS